jgi:hypothetical protein
MKKLVLFAAIAATVVFGACSQKKSAVKANTSEPQQEVVTAVQEETVAPFEYQSPLPHDGKLKGVVELGSTGFNSFIINLDKDRNWKLEKAEFGASGVLEGATSEADVLAKLKTYIKGIIDGGVKGSNIYFVVSSGAQEESVVKTIISALKKLGYVVNAVTPEQEGTYALKSVLPQKYEGNAFVVDLGSGNTKISWIKDGKIETADSYGAKYFSKGVDAQSVYRAVSEVSKSIPDVNREICFIIGGVPFQMAKSHRFEKERYTTLKSEKAYSSDKFQDDKSLAGLNIYKAIRETTGCKTFVFDWDANFTVGFLLSIPY